MTNTKHVADCRMAFGRKDPNCPRCRELLAGSAPRTGWQQQYFASKHEHESARVRAIAQHNCAVSGCGPVCTTFDW